MNQSNAVSTEEAGFGAWLGFWAQFIVLGFLAVLGAFFASGDSAPGEYTCGLILSLAAIALAFLRLKHWSTHCIHTSFKDSCCAAILPAFGDSQRSITDIIRSKSMGLTR